MKTIIFALIMMISSLSIVRAETVKVGCIFEKENLTQIHRIFELETESDGQDVKFFSISPDFSRVVEVNNREEGSNEIFKDDIAVAIVAINSVEISMAMGRVLNLFPGNLGEVMTIGETSNAAVDYVASSLVS